MGLFKKDPVQCPVCAIPLDKRVNIAVHNVGHALPADDGGGGFMWRCGCGEFDGVWDTETGAAAGLTLHMNERHGVPMF